MDKVKEKLYKYANKIDLFKNLCMYDYDNTISVYYKVDGHIMVYCFEYTDFTVLIYDYID